MQGCRDGYSREGRVIGRRCKYVAYRFKSHVNLGCFTSVMRVKLLARNVDPASHRLLRQTCKSRQRLGFSKGKAAIGGRLAVGHDHLHPVPCKIYRIFIAHMRGFRLRRIPQFKGNTVALGFLSLTQPLDQVSSFGLAASRLRKRGCKKCRTESSKDFHSKSNAVRASVRDNKFRIRPLKFATQKSFSHV